MSGRIENLECPAWVISIDVVILENAKRGSRQVIVLPRLDSPHECGQCCECQQKRDWYEEKENIHALSPGAVH